MPLVRLRASCGFCVSRLTREVFTRSVCFLLTYACCCFHSMSPHWSVAQLLRPPEQVARGTDPGAAESA